MFSLKKYILQTWLLGIEEVLKCNFFLEKNKIYEDIIEDLI